MPLPPLLLERLKRKKALSELGLESSEKESNGTEEGRRKKKSRGSVAEYSYQDTSGPSVVNSELVATNGDAVELEEEEIIAEDYSDDEGKGGTRPETSGDKEQKNCTKTKDCDKIAFDKESSDELKNFDKHENSQLNQVKTWGESVLGCPNKYNVYHECSQYCEDNFGKPEALEPTLEQRKQLAMILRTYPMSNEWTVVYDPGVRTFYFWNIITNLVSWFPPAMEGFVSLPADQIRKSILVRTN